MAAQIKASDIWKPKSLPVYETNYSNQLGYNERHITQQLKHDYINRYDANVLNVKHDNLEFVVPLYRRDSLGFRKRFPQMDKKPVPVHPLYTKPNASKIPDPDVVALADRTQYDSFGFYIPTYRSEKKIPQLPSTLAIRPSNNPCRPTATPLMRQIESHNGEIEASQLSRLPPDTYDIYANPPVQYGSQNDFNTAGLAERPSSGRRSGEPCRAHGGGVSLGLGQPQIRSFFEGY